MTRKSALKFLHCVKYQNHQDLCVDPCLLAQNINSHPHTMTIQVCLLHLKLVKIAIQHSGLKGPISMLYENMPFFVTSGHILMAVQS